MLARVAFLGVLFATPAFACKREPPTSSRVRAPGVVVDTCCEGLRCTVTVTPEVGAPWSFETHEPSSVLPWPGARGVVEGAQLVTPSARLRPEVALTPAQRAEVPPRCAGTCGCTSRFELAGLTATGVVMEAWPEGGQPPVRVHLDAVRGEVKPWAPRQEACAEVLASRSFGTAEERVVRLTEVLFALEDAPSRECVEALASLGVEPPRAPGARGSFERLALHARVRLVLAAARYPSLAWVAWLRAPREAVSATGSTREELQAWVFFLRPRFVGAVVVLVGAVLVAWRTRQRARRAALVVALLALGVAALEGPDALAFARRDVPSLGFVPGELFERAALNACK